MVSVLRVVSCVASPIQRDTILSPRMGSVGNIARLWCFPRTCLKTRNQAVSFTGYYSQINDERLMLHPLCGTLSSPILRMIRKSIERIAEHRIRAFTIVQCARSLCIGTSR